MRNDFLAAIMANPGKTFSDLNQMGVTPSDTSMSDKKTYEGIPEIQQAFKNEKGEFDSKRFDNYYDSAVQFYNEFKGSDISFDHNTLRKYNIASPYSNGRNEIKSSLVSYSKLSGNELANMRKGATHDILRGWSKPTKTDMEVAMDRKIINYETGEEMAYSVNDLGVQSLYGLFESDAYVLSKHEKDVFDSMGRKIHEKGEVKLDDEGYARFETLGGRDSATQEVFSRTTHFRNQLNPFDTSDLERSIPAVVWDTAMKLTPFLGRRLTPWVAAYYVGKDLMNMSLEVTQMYKNFDGKGRSKTIDNIQGILKSTENKMSKHGENKMLSVENIGNIAFDSVTQLVGQRSFAEGMTKMNLGVKSMFKNGALNPTEIQSAIKLASDVSKGYMVAASAMEINETARKNGMTGAESAALVAGYTAGLSLMYSKLNISEVALKGLGLDDLGRDINKATEKIASQVSGKMFYKASNQSTQKQILKASDGVIDEATKKSLMREGIVEGTRISKKYLARLNAAMASGELVGSMLGEGLEEMSETTIQTGVEKIYNAFNKAGMSDKEYDGLINKSLGTIYRSLADMGFTSKRRIDTDKDLNEFMLELAASGFGGAIGGAAFTGFGKLKNYGKDSDIADSDIFTLVANGYGDVIKDRTRKMLKSGELLGESDLSVETIVKDGDLYFKPVEKGQMNQQEVIAQKIEQTVDMIETLLKSNGFSDPKLTIQDKEKRIGSFVNLSIDTDIYDYIMDSQRSFLRASLELENAQKTLGTENLTHTEDQIKELEQKVKDEKERYDLLISDKSDKFFFTQALYNANEEFRSIYDIAHLDELTKDVSNGSYKSFNEISIKSKDKNLSDVEKKKLNEAIEEILEKSNARAKSPEYKRILSDAREDINKQLEKVKDNKEEFDKFVKAFNKNKNVMLGQYSQKNTDDNDDGLLSLVSAHIDEDMVLGRSEAKELNSLSKESGMSTNFHQENMHAIIAAVKSDLFGRDKGEEYTYLPKAVRSKLFKYFNGLRRGRNKMLNFGGSLSKFHDLINYNDSSVDDFEPSVYLGNNKLSDLFEKLQSLSGLEIDSPNSVLANDRTYEDFKDVYALLNSLNTNPSLDRNDYATDDLYIDALMDGGYVGAAISFLKLNDDKKIDTQGKNTLIELITDMRDNVIFPIEQILMSFEKDEDGREKKDIRFEQIGSHLGKGKFDVKGLSFFSESVENIEAFLFEELDKARTNPSEYLNSSASFDEDVDAAIAELKKLYVMYNVVLSDINVKVNEFVNNGDNELATFVNPMTKESQDGDELVVDPVLAEALSSDIGSMVNSLLYLKSLNDYNRSNTTKKLKREGKVRRYLQAKHLIDIAHNISGLMPGQHIDSMTDIIDSDEFEHIKEMSEKENALDMTDEESSELLASMINVESRIHLAANLIMVDRDGIKKVLQSVLVNNDKDDNSGIKEGDEFLSNKEKDNYAIRVLSVSSKDMWEDILRFDQQSGAFGYFNENDKNPKAPLSGQTEALCIAYASMYGNRQLWQEISEHKSKIESSTRAKYSNAVVVFSPPGAGKTSVVATNIARLAEFKSGRETIALAPETAQAHGIKRELESSGITASDVSGTIKEFFGNLINAGDSSIFSELTTDGQVVSHKDFVGHMDFNQMKSPIISLLVKHGIFVKNQNDEFELSQYAKNKLSNIGSIIIDEVTQADTRVLMALMEIIEQARDEGHDIKAIFIGDNMQLGSTVEGFKRSVDQLSILTTNKLSSSVRSEWNLINDTLGEIQHIEGMIHEILSNKDNSSLHESELASLLDNNPINLYHVIEGERMIGFDRVENKGKDTEADIKNIMKSFVKDLEDANSKNPTLLYIVDNDEDRLHVVGLLSGILGKDRCDELIKNDAITITTPSSMDSSIGITTPKEAQSRQSDYVIISAKSRVDGNDGTYLALRRFEFFNTMFSRAKTAALFVDKDGIGSDNKFVPTWKASSEKKARKQVKFTKEVVDDFKAYFINDMAAVMESDSYMNAPSSDLIDVEFSGRANKGFGNLIKPVAKTDDDAQGDNDAKDDDSQEDDDDKDLLDSNQDLQNKIDTIKEMFDQAIWLGKGSVDLYDINKLIGAARQFATENIVSLKLRVELERLEDIHLCLLSARAEFDRVRELIESIERGDQVEVIASRMQLVGTEGGLNYYIKRLNNNNYNTDYESNTYIDRIDKAIEILDSKDEELTKLKKESELSKQRIAKLEEEKAKTEADMQELKARLDNLSSVITQKEIDIQNKEKQIEEAKASGSKDDQNKIEALNGELAALRDELNAAQSQAAIEQEAKKNLQAEAEDVEADLKLDIESQNQLIAQLAEFDQTQEELSFDGYNQAVEDLNNAKKKANKSQPKQKGPTPEGCKGVKDPYSPESQLPIKKNIGGQLRIPKPRKGPDKPVELGMDKRTCYDVVFKDDVAAIMSAYGITENEAKRLILELRTIALGFKVPSGNVFNQSPKFSFTIQDSKKGDELTSAHPFVFPQTYEKNDKILRLNASFPYSEKEITITVGSLFLMPDQLDLFNNSICNRSYDLEELRDVVDIINAGISTSAEGIARSQMKLKQLRDERPDIFFSKPMVIAMPEADENDLPEFLTDLMETNEIKRLKNGPETLKAIYLEFRDRHNGTPVSFMASGMDTDMDFENPTNLFRNYLALRTYEELGETSALEIGGYSITSQQLHPVMLIKPKFEFTELAKLISDVCEKVIDVKTRDSHTRIFHSLLNNYNKSKLLRTLSVIVNDDAVANIDAVSRANHKIPDIIYNLDIREAFKMLGRSANADDHTKGGTLLEEVRDIVNNAISELSEEKKTKLYKGEVVDDISIFKLRGLFDSKEIAAFVDVLLKTEKGKEAYPDGKIALNFTWNKEDSTTKNTGLIPADEAYMATDLVVETEAIRGVNAVIKNEALNIFYENKQGAANNDGSKPIYEGLAERDYNLDGVNIKITQTDKITQEEYDQLVNLAKDLANGTSGILREISVTNGDFTVNGDKINSIEDLEKLKRNSADLKRYYPEADFYFGVKEILDGTIAGEQDNIRKVYEKLKKGNIKPRFLYENESFYLLDKESNKFIVSDSDWDKAISDMSGQNKTKNIGVLTEFARHEESLNRLFYSKGAKITRLLKEVDVDYIVDLVRKTEKLVGEIRVINKGNAPIRIEGIDFNGDSVEIILNTTGIEYIVTPSLLGTIIPDDPIIKTVGSLLKGLSEITGINNDAFNNAMLERLLPDSSILEDLSNFYVDTINTLEFAIDKMRGYDYASLVGGHVIAKPTIPASGDPAYVFSGNISKAYQSLDIEAVDNICEIYLDGKGVNSNILEGVEYGEYKEQSLNEIEREYLLNSLFLYNMRNSVDSGVIADLLYNYSDDLPDPSKIDDLFLIYTQSLC